MSTCPKCQSGQRIKDDIDKGKQRYHCKSCGYKYKESHKWYSEAVKQQAMSRYLKRGIHWVQLKLLSCSGLQLDRNDG
jgi:transposase-like protein